MSNANTTSVRVKPRRFRGERRCGGRTPLHAGVIRGCTTDFTDGTDGETAWRGERTSMLDLTAEIAKTRPLSWEDEADGRRRRNVAGGPVGGGVGVAQPIHTETDAAALLGAAVAEQDIARLKVVAP